MATAEQVGKAALQEILVQGGESPLEADYYQDFIFAMNNFMADLAANGVSLGYTVVTKLADAVTIPTGALRGLVKNMAVELCPQYGAVASPFLLAQASSGMDTMRMVGQTIPESAYPGTLPIGTGNYNEQYGLGQFYYPDQEAEILGESTGSIGLESGTDA